MSSQRNPADAARVVAFSPLRRQGIDWLEIERHKHLLHGLLEVDVTDTRRMLKEYRARTGAPLSLTAYLIWCFARTVAEDPRMQATRLGRDRLVLFDDVDVGTMVERAVDGVRMPLPYVIRSAQSKSLDEIARELRFAQVTRPDDVALGSVPRRLKPLFRHGLSAWLALPAPVRFAVWNWALHDPYRRKSLMGTVGLSAVGMFGHGTGWGIAPMAHTLTLLVGSIATRPGVLDDRIVPRDYLCLTLTADHDVVDGAPAARFANRLVKAIERGLTPAPSCSRDGPESSSGARSHTTLERAS